MTRGSEGGARWEEGAREGEGEIDGETEGWVRQAWCRRYSGPLRRLAAGRWAARLAAQGFEANNPTPRDTVKFIDAEIAKWGKVIKEGGIKGD